MAKNKLTQEKALEILSDGRVHGKRLTRKQKKFFGAVAGGAAPEKAENGIEGTMGGLTDKGFNFNPAWGGAWKNGGWMEKYTDSVPMAQFGLTYLEPNSPKLPRVGPSSELAMSVGGENGEPAYLIPSMKYGRMQVDPEFEFKRTGEHLGGPFKTWQEAEAWERDVRHPYVEKGQSIPTPYRRWGQFAMGGSLPGSVGFTYARVAGAAPSEGPRAKKTLPSAQNGMEMKYYQEGLDWKPKTISKNGGWLDKYNEDIPTAQTGDVLEYLKKDKAAPVVTKGKPLTAEQQKRIAAETLKRQTQKSKPLTQLSAKQIKQQQYDLKQKAEDEVLARDRRIEEEEERARIAEGKAAEATRENPNVPFTFPTGESKLWKDMDWRERQYVSGKNLGSMFRSDNWTDYINPLAMIGDAGEGLATAPYIAQQTDSYLPYVTGVGTPLLTGALAGIGSPKFKEFAENVLSPLPFSQIKKAVNKKVNDLTSTSSKMSIKDAVEKVLPNVERETGVERVIKLVHRDLALVDPEKIKQAHKRVTAALSESDASPDNIYAAYKLMMRNELASEMPTFRNARVMTESGEPYIYGSDMHPETYEIFSQEDPVSWTGDYKSDFPNILEKFKNTEGYKFHLKPTNEWGYDASKKTPEEIATLLSYGGYDEVDSLLNTTLRKGDANSIRLYNKYIDQLNNAIQKNKFPFPTTVRRGLHDYEVKLLDPKTFKPTGNVKKKSELSVGDVFMDEGFSSTTLDIERGSIGVPQASEIIEIPGGGVQSYAYLNSFSGSPFFTEYEVLLPKGLIRKVEEVREPIDGTKYLNNARFRTSILNPYAVTAPVVGGVAATVLSDQQQPQQQKKGGVIKDNMGYWNPANRGKVVEISSPYITMKGVDQPLIGVSNTGDVQYMEPGNDYEFDGTSVREYPVAAQGVSVNKADEYPLEKLDNLLNFTNYNKPKAKNGWLEKYK